jgi:hypothetical protein
MPRKIILDKISTKRDVLPDIDSNSSFKDEHVTTEKRFDLITYSQILKATIDQYPNKMLFSIKESAVALSVSPEFIRKRISDGSIKSVNLGDRKMISINELAKIIYKGV